MGGGGREGVGGGSIMAEKGRWYAGQIGIGQTVVGTGVTRAVDPDPDGSAFILPPGSGSGRETEKGKRNC